MDLFISRILLAVVILRLIFHDGPIELIISLLVVSSLFSIASSIRNFGKPTIWGKILDEPKQEEKKKE